MSSNSIPHFQKFAPRLPRMSSGAVARTKRTKSAVSPVCPKCHDFVPRAGERSSGAKRAQGLLVSRFSYLFLVVAVEADRTRALTIGISSRHDWVIDLFVLVAVVACGQRGASRKNALSVAAAKLRATPWASPVPADSEHRWQAATGVSAILLAYSSDRRISRPGAGADHPSEGSFPAGHRLRWRRSPISGQLNSVKIRLTRLTDCTPQLTCQCPVPFLFSEPLS
jgi:hypothetical protein